MKVVGLMSGTSCDGVDAALVDITGKFPKLTIKQIAFASIPYSPPIRREIIAVSRHGTVSEICHLNALLGEVFAKAATRVIRKSGLPSSAIHVIGSHGQTIHHLPVPIRVSGIGNVRSTLQIAEPAIIAERTGISTIGNFRARDMAAGGQGAPLAPFVHHVLFRHPSQSRLILNLGGIGNVTYLPSKGQMSSILAFDTGPGNMMLDGLINRYTRGTQSFDRGGKLAAKGTINSFLLQQLMTHPYLQKVPPKTTGREDFGEQFLGKILRYAQQKKLSKEDVLATCAWFTAVTVGGSRQWISGKVNEVIVGGGGVFNRTVMRNLRKVFDPVPVQSFEDMGWSSKAFEAVAFAVLAYQTIQGKTGNVPSVTGAKSSVILGTIVPGGRQTKMAFLKKG